MFDGSGDVDGADADLVVDGCLIDIKTTIDPARLDREWVYQVFGYVLLDYHDSYELKAVGVYLTRQGRLICWPFAEWLPRLTGRTDVSLAGLRAEFHRLVEDQRQSGLARAAARAARPREEEGPRETIVGAPPRPPCEATKADGAQCGEPAPYVAGPRGQRRFLCNAHVHSTRGPVVRLPTRVRLSIGKPRTKDRPLSTRGPRGRTR